MSITFSPALFAHFTMFCALVTAAVTMWILASRRTPLMPSGSRMPSWSSMMNSCGITWMTSRSIGIATALAASITRRTSLSRDLAVLHRDDAVGVEAVDVAARDAGVDRGDLAVGHQLGLFDRVLDRVDGGVDVDHHALAQAPRRVRADPDDVDAVSVASATMAQIFVVPMSSPTIRLSLRATALHPPTKPRRSSPSRAARLPQQLRFRRARRREAQHALPGKRRSIATARANAGSFSASTR